MAHSMKRAATHRRGHLLIKRKRAEAEHARLYQLAQAEIAERQLVEAALRKSEQRYRQIVETSQEGIWLIDAASKTTFVNAKLAELLGYTVDEMIGMPLFAFMDAEGQALATASLERRRQGIADQLDFKLLRKDGTPIWTLVNTNPLQDDAGGYLGALAMLTDITARRQTEEQLRYQADLLEQVSDAIISTDASFKIKSWNAAAEALYGWPAQDVFGRPMSEILPTTYLDGNPQLALASLLEQRRWQGEVVQPHRDGTSHTILSSVSLLQDGAGNLTGMVGVNRDISERKRSEQALQRAANRLRVLADASRAFAEVGTEYQTLLDQIARTTTDVLGDGCSIRLLSEDEEWLDLVALCVLDSEKLELTRSAMGEAPLRVGEPSLATQTFHSRQPLLIAFFDQAQVRAAMKPEYMSWVDRLGIHSMIVVPIRLQGRSIGVLIVYRYESAQPPFDQEDLTLAQDLADRAALAITNARLLEQVQRELAERTKAEAEVRTLSATLEQRVIARTAALTAANEELEAFSYSVSHDLRAPLRAIDGFSRILLEDHTAALPEAAQHYFQLVRSNAQQMGQLVDDLLAFSHLGRQALARRSVDPTELVQQCLDELRTEQVGRQVVLTIGALPACAADPALLKQVWINLLSNALKYTRQRDPARIEIGSQSADGETVYVIKDNGVGFDTRYSDKLFGVFQRMHRAEDYEGTGVGLAIVQRIIHRHGGRVWATAEVDHGATFYFTLGEDTP